MLEDAAELASRLARNAEAVCRHYLSNGRRHGRYWRVGDADNTPGGSLFVRLYGPERGRGAAGRWTDAATGEGGDLLDLIGRARGLDRFPDILAEARRFLGLPTPRPDALTCVRGAPAPVPREPARTREAARRLFRTGRTIGGTPAETYLRSRGITQLADTGALRFHSRCYHRAQEGAPLESWPALLAAVTDLNGVITGVHRTWLARDGSGKAPLADPRRALGNLAGHGVRFGRAGEALVIGEGIETVLSLRCGWPHLPAVAALSAAHLAAYVLPMGLRRLYVAQDRDAAGQRAAETLVARAETLGIEARVLLPQGGDFNDDLQHLGAEELAARLCRQLADVAPPGTSATAIALGARP